MNTKFDELLESIAVTVISKDHIETIYKTLNAIEEVRYVL